MSQNTRFQASPMDDPQDHYIKRVCGRIAGGLIVETPTKDLKEVVAYIQQEIDWREHAKDEFKALSVKPF